MTAMTPARITFRLHRFEVVAFTLLAMLGVVAAIVIAARLDAVGYGAQCIEANRTGAVTPPGCEFKVNVFYEIVTNEASVLFTLMTVVPFVAALLLGVSVVGREIERGTTRLAWALTPSRQRWFLHRLVPVVLIVAGLTFALGIVADRLLASTEPGLDPGNAFAQFGARGAILAARAVFILGLGIFVGGIMGRALPALIVAGILAAVGIAGGEHFHQQMLRSEAVVLEDPQNGDLYVDQKFRLPDGRLVGWDQIEQYDPPPTDAELVDGVQWPRFPEVMLGVPGSRYREVELREVGVLAGGSLVLILATAAVVQRRRPG